MHIYIKMTKLGLVILTRYLFATLSGNSPSPIKVMYSASLNSRSKLQLGINGAQLSHRPKCDPMIVVLW